MRYLIFVLISLALDANAFSNPVDSTSIYFTSLSNHLEYLKSLKKNANGLNEVYVEKSEITESLPSDIGSVHISYLTLSEIKAKTTKGKRIHLIVVRPVKVESTLLRVNVIDFFVTSNKEGFNYANTGGSVFEFRFDCERNRFLVSNKKQGGI